MRVLDEDRPSLDNLRAGGVSRVMLGLVAGAPGRKGGAGTNEPGVVSDGKHWRRMRIQTGQLVSLGYGKYVRSDDVVAIAPIVEGRGPGRRTLVWVRGVSDPLEASRAEGSIVDDLVTPAEEAARMRQQRAALAEFADSIDKVSPALRRVIAEESDVDLTGMADQARRLLS